MQAPSQNAREEAKQLGGTLEFEDGEWIAVLPAHPDLSNDESLGLPAASEAEALDELRAYRAIETSSVYKFDYLEDRDVYKVSFGDQSFEGQLLAKTYADAQKAYAEHINQPQPPAHEPPPAASEKPPHKRQRRTSNGNGRKNQGHDATGRSVQGGEVSSGIGPGPAQLPPATHPIDPQLQRGQPEQQVPHQHMVNFREAGLIVATALEEVAQRIKEKLNNVPS